jgi:hypothetical protein
MDRSKGGPPDVNGQWILKGRRMAFGSILWQLMHYWRAISTSHMVSPNGKQLRGISVAATEADCWFFNPHANAEIPMRRYWRFCPPSIASRSRLSHSAGTSRPVRV